MKTRTSIYITSVGRLLLMVPVICSMEFAACFGVAGTPRRHLTVNLQKALVRKPQTGNYVTIGPKTYNSKDHAFDRPWPFGPEFNPQ